MKLLSILALSTYFGLTSAFGAYDIQIDPAQSTYIGQWNSSHINFKLSFLTHKDTTPYPSLIVKPNGNCESSGEIPSANLLSKLTMGPIEGDTKRACYYTGEIARGQEFGLYGNEYGVPKFCKFTSFNLLGARIMVVS